MLRVILKEAWGDQWIAVVTHRFQVLLKSWKNLRVEYFLIASEGIYRFILTLLEFLLPPVIANEFVKLRGLTLNIPTLSIIITELESFLLVGWTSNTVQVTRWVLLT